MPNLNADSLTLSRLEDLKDTARKLSIEILFADFADPEVSTQSGYCKVRGREMILVDKRLSVSQQIEVLLGIFQQLDLEDVYIASWIRERLENPETIGIPS